MAPASKGALLNIHYYYYYYESAITGDAHSWSSITSSLSLNCPVGDPSVMDRHTTTNITFYFMSPVRSCFQYALLNILVELEGFYKGTHQTVIHFLHLFVDLHHPAILTRGDKWRM